MGEVYILSVLVPESKVSISQDRKILRIEQLGETQFINPLQPKKKISVSNPTHFDTLIEVPESADRACVLIKCDMAFEGNFTPKALDLIKKGAHYTTILAGDSQVNLSDITAEIQCDFGFVLSESSHGAILLGVLHAVPQQLVDDENVVAVLDILGFSNIMMTESIEEIESNYTQTLMGVLNFVGFTSVGGFILDESGNLEVAEGLWTISYGVFSDTVVMYPKKLIQNPIRAICEAVATTIDFALRTTDWLFRGGIEIGTFRHNQEHHLYLGTAIIRAHNIETEQEWSGCIIGPETIKRFPNEIAELKKDRIIVEYDVPFKDREKIKKMFPDPPLALNWCYFDLGQNDERRKALCRLLTKAPHEAKNKLRNTIKFEETMREMGFASIKQISGKAFGDPTGGNEIIG